MVSTRLATADDAAELVRLREIMLGEMDLDDPMTDEWQRSVTETLRSRLAEQDDSMAVFVVEDAATVSVDGVPGLAACAVGLVEWRLGGPTNPPGEVGYILNVSTDPKHRRRGYSRACMRALLDWYRRRGVASVDLQATAAGEPLYRELGFQSAPGSAMRMSLHRDS